METNTILHAEFLDILFEGRNKLYGAYDLRNSYNKRVSTALLVTLSTFLIIVAGTMIGRSMGNDPRLINPVYTEHNLEKAPEPKVKPTLPPPPPVAPPPPVRTLIYPPPRIVRDQEVIKPPIEVKELVDAKIGDKNQDGLKDIGAITPPTVERNSAVIEAPPTKAGDDDLTLITVQIQAAFPGGQSEWLKYVKKAVEKNLDELTEAGEAGTCRVKFIVDKEGIVSDVEALTMRGTKLAEIAVNVIRKGPKWTPAQQNGRYVKAFHEQPVTFSIEN